MKRTFQQQLTDTAPDTNNFDLKTVKFPENEVFCLQRVAICNKTSSTKTASVGAIVGSSIYWLETITLPTAGLIYALKNDTFINTCKGIVVRFNSPSAGDVCEAYCYGFYVE